MNSSRREFKAPPGMNWFGPMFFIVLFLLKVGVADTRVQDWSWWWITAPLWGSAAVAAALMIFAFIMMAVAEMLDK